MTFGKFFGTTLLLAAVSARAQSGDPTGTWFNEDKDGVIRVKGTRVTLEVIVTAFDAGATAEEIAQQYPTVGLEAAYALHKLGLHALVTYQPGSRFWLFQGIESGIYVASGLGLLLTTSFLGLRRYLRQRRLEMPVTMAPVWLLLGAKNLKGIT